MQTFTRPTFNFLDYSSQEEIVLFNTELFSQDQRSFCDTDKESRISSTEGSTNELALVRVETPQNIVIKRFNEPDQTAKKTE